MDTNQLHHKIQELAQYSPANAAEWVNRLKREPIEVIIGAIYEWVPGSGVSAGADARAPKREAARAIIEARLTEQLERSAARLQRVGIGVGLVAAILAAIQVYIQVSGA